MIERMRKEIAKELNLGRKDEHEIKSSSYGTSLDKIITIIKTFYNN